MSSKTRLLFGGIESGGTKLVCAIGTETGEILAETCYPTTLPDETLMRTMAFFEERVQVLDAIAAIGVASFMP